MNIVLGDSNLLGLILKELSFPDRYKARRVAQSWRGTIERFHLVDPAKNQSPKSVARN